MKYKTLSTKLPPQTEQKFINLTKQKQTTKSMYLRILIENEIKNNGKQLEKILNQQINKRIQQLKEAKK